MEYNNEYNRIAPYIASDEYVLWKGKPEKGNLITSVDILITIIFFVLIIIVSLFDIFIFTYAGSNKLFARGIMVLLVCIYIAVGRFFHTGYLRKRTYYVITNKKVIRLRKNTIDTIDGKRIHNIRMTLYKNGCGTITLGKKDYQRKSYGSNKSDFGVSDKYDGMFELENIANIAHVKNILDQMDK